MMMTFARPQYRCGGGEGLERLNKSSERDDMEWLEIGNIECL